jgi:hypothetical protein
MAFTDYVLQQAWKRAGGKCECRRWTHNHSVVKCGKELVLANRGKEGPGRWEVRRIDKAVGDTLSNCEILCADCYKRALYE